MYMEGWVDINALGSQSYGLELLCQPCKIYSTAKHFYNASVVTRDRRIGSKTTSIAPEEVNPVLSKYCINL
jgi:hypothetical protein